MKIVKKLTACLVIVFAAMLIVGHAQSVVKRAATEPRNGQTDFDFEIGTWRTHLRRLKDPLSGSNAWVEYTGTTVVRKVWNGRANLVELDVAGEAGRIEALSLRLYNPASGQWSLNFSNVRGGTMATPTVGEFKNGRGEFYSHEEINGRMVLVRFVYIRHHTRLVPVRASLLNRRRQNVGNQLDRDRHPRARNARWFKQMNIQLMLKPFFRLSSLGFIIAAAAILVSAQSFILDLPLKSQAAEVSQRIGVTDVSIKYSRPLVNGRKIWGGLVPYGQVWRTGANTNTTITFSDPVTIEGKRLEKGSYGLHTIPNAGEWTIIFSKNATSWGSFSYDAAEDALRVNVKPVASEMHDALAFEFDELRADSAVIKLKWEKVEVPIKLAVDVKAAVRASLKNQLRDLPGYNWMSWDDAAGYLLSENIGLDDALAYADKSIALEDRFDNELTKSKVLAALNRSADAAAAQKKALDLATPLQVHQFARALIDAKRADEAYATFRDNAAKHPDLWFVHDGLARAYSGQGKIPDAVREMKMAIERAPSAQKSTLGELLKRLEAGQDINRQ